MASNTVVVNRMTVFVVSCGTGQGSGYTGMCIQGLGSCKSYSIHTVCIHVLYILYFIWYRATLLHTLDLHCFFQCHRDSSWIGAHGYKKGWEI